MIHKVNNLSLLCCDQPAHHLGKKLIFYTLTVFSFFLSYFPNFTTGSTALNSSVSEVPRKSTVGSLDMGGGSAQIAFEVGKSVSIQHHSIWNSIQYYISSFKNVNSPIHYRHQKAIKLLKD